MKKIKITEKQAKLLGLETLSEVSGEESGLKSFGVALGDKVIRVVVEGDALKDKKEAVLKIIYRQDPEANVNYYDATNKIVGTIKDSKFNSIKRDIKSLDPLISFYKKTITKSLKEGRKNKVKITKEQYNRIFASNIIKENSEPIENNSDELKNETIELIKYLYRKSDQLSPFWKKHNLSYEDICKLLLDKKLIISVDGKYELSKSNGSPQNAIESVQNELSNAIGSNPSHQSSTPQTEPTQPPNDSEEKPIDEIQDEESIDSSKPKSPTDKQLNVVAYNREIAILKDPSGVLYVFLYDHINKNDFMDYASVTRYYVGKDEEGKPEYDYDGNFEIDASALSNYVNDKLGELTKGVGANDFEQGIDLVKIDDSLKQELLSLYDKDKSILNVLNPIEEELKPEVQLPATKPKSKIVAKLQDLKKNKEIDEMTSAGSSGQFTAPMSPDPIKRKMPNEAIPIVGEAFNLGKGYTHFAIFKNDNKIATGWDYSSLYDKHEKKYDNDSIKEYVRGDLRDAFPDNKTSDFTIITREKLIKDGIDPSDTTNWYKVGVTETTTATAGNYQYDTPGGLTLDLKSKGKTPAQKKTQYAGGSFVSFNECTELNNKPAGSGCSQGAVDKVVKTHKTNGNINAPSLKEDIIKKIATRTGKSVNEIKEIIIAKTKTL